MTSHQELIAHLRRSGVLKTPAIIQAFEAIDRRHFIPPSLVEVAYADTALPLGQGQTISQPYTVAFMLERLQPQAGHVILDVGSGSGWQTALLAAIAGPTGKVVALEIIPRLCAMGRGNINHYNFIKQGVVEVRCQSGRDGYRPAAPYDRIIAAAAGHTVPSAWREQLKIGGRIVCPVESSIVALTKKSKDEWEEEIHPGFAFVPLVST